MDEGGQRRMLRDVIKEQVMARILDGTYPPGARLVESQLAQEFGTSQAPVREALRDLVGMRFIESRPHVGSRVRAITHEELGQIYPVRAALEELAGRLAAPRTTDDGLRRLEEELAAMRRAAEAGDVQRQVAHDARFHEIIVETAANDALLQVWRSLRVEASALISLIKSDANLRMIAEMHRPILTALESRDPDVAGKEMRAHIEFFGSFVVRASDPAPGALPGPARDT
jgi:DNA-binding GntR family transcriptional regulator